MKKTLQIIAPLLIACLGLVGWWLWRHYIPQTRQTLASPIPFTQQLSALDSKGFSQLEEIARFTTPTTSGPVVAVALPAGKDELLAAYSGDHYVRRWNLANGSLAAELKLDWISAKGTKFSADGARLAAGRTVWNAITGECLTIPCEEIYWIENGEELIYPKGSWLVGYNQGSHHLGINCINSFCNETKSYSLGDFEDPMGLLTISKVALDATGGFAAVAFEQGTIRIYRFTGNANLDIIHRVELGERWGIAPTRTLIFDETRSWLASVRVDELTVWDLRLGRNQRHFSAQVPTVNVLAFDHSGKFLLVGTESALQVWDVTSKRLLKEYATDSVSALIVSPDGRLVIWGDDRGVVHLWGSAAP